MVYDNDAITVAQQWQGQLDESLEAGDALWLEGGFSQHAVALLSALTALDWLAHHRSDVTTPGFLIGGDGIAWTAALISQAADTTAGLALTPFSGGADVVTYMATLATLPAPSTHTRRAMTTGLPAGMQSLLLPSSQPGIAPFWSCLPFLVAAQPSSTVTNRRLRSGEAWLPWLTLMLVIGLIIAALFI